MFLHFEIDQLTPYCLLVTRFTYNNGSRTFSTTRDPLIPAGLLLRTCFLVTLASGKRCSEVHALLHSRVIFGENYSVVTLEPSNRFIAKNQLAKQGTAVLNPIYHQISCCHIKPRT